MEDEEDFTSPLDFATLSGMARQADAQVQAQIKNYRDMLAEGTRRMREQRIGPSNSEFLLSLAQALGKPTRTGKFGERMALVANTLGGQESARREAELAREARPEGRGVRAGRCTDAREDAVGYDGTVSGGADGCQSRWGWSVLFWDKRRPHPEARYGRPTPVPRAG